MTGKPNAERRRWKPEQVLGARLNINSSISYGMAVREMEVFSLTETSSSCFLLVFSQTTNEGTWNGTVFWTVSTHLRKETDRSHGCTGSSVDRRRPPDRRHWRTSYKALESIMKTNTFLTRKNAFWVGEGFTPSNTSFSEEAGLSEWMAPFVSRLSVAAQ
jgi:hypothetical protein